MMRKFCIYLDNDEDAEIAIHQDCFDAVDDEWRAALYDLRTDYDIAMHIGHNLIINGIRLSQMDGWADMPDSHAGIICWYGSVTDDTEVMGVREL